jgi:hypothetical protein
MNIYTLLGIILIGLFLLWAWRSDRRQKEQQAKQMAETEERRTSEEHVIQQQMKFEKRLHDGVEIGLPDAVRGRSAHIYRYLMREWFNKLAAQSRYDQPKLKKLRKDWLIYMEMLETSRTSNFLSLESRDEAAREKHARAAEEEKVQLAAIEDAFAEAIGPEAVEKLRETRARTWDSFSDEGELGVEGQYRIPSYLLRQIERRRVRSPPSHHEET